MPEKIMKMDEEKRLRIINAAMREFGRWGYNEAKTDNIARDAGISKGLLFHYFGTKKQLFLHVFQYAVQLFEEQCNQVSMDDDIFERLRQNTKLKMDYIQKYPDLINFGIGVRLKGAGDMQEEITARMEPMNRRIYASMFEGLDLTRFRDDIDPWVAVHIILWTVEGFSNKIIAEYQNRFKGEPIENIEASYDGYTEEFESYLRVLKKSLYQ